MAFTTPARGSRRPQPAQFKTNYLIGNGPADWQTDVTFSLSVRFTNFNIYPGIDLDYLLNKGRLTVISSCQPGANPAQNPRLNFTRWGQTTLEADGSLLLLKDSEEGNVLVGGVNGVSK